MKNKLRQAYIRGMIDLSLTVAVNGCLILFAWDVLNKYFM